MARLRSREAAVRERLKCTAGGLRDTVAGAVQRERREHPWVLPLAGFCAGLLIPFLLPDRRSAAREAFDEEEGESPRIASKLQDAWAEARCVAAATLTEAIGGVIRRVFAAESMEARNGCSR